MSWDYNKVDCTIGQLKQRLAHIIEYPCGCQVEAAKLTDLDYKEVLLACTLGDDGDEIFSATDSNRFIIASLHDGRVAVWTENEDYTGHG